MRKPVKAYGGNGRSAIYEFADGTGFMKNGGSITWRNNNPGAINSSEFARRNGGIGNNGRFAVFTDPETGEDGVYLLLSGKIYQKLTLGEAIAKYAPKEDKNDVEAYIKFVTDLTGFHRNDKMSKFRKAQIWSIIKAIVKREVYKVGVIVPLDKEQLKRKKRYRWRTVGDKNVRPEHAEREGRIFRFDKPNFDHPGEAYGCRCWPEAFEYDRVKNTNLSPALRNPFQIQILSGGSSRILI